jgi:ammonium transporter, Amt family
MLALRSYSLSRSWLAAVLFFALTSLAYPSLTWAQADAATTTGEAPTNEAQETGTAPATTASESPTAETPTAEPTATPTTAELEAKINSAALAGHNAWMLVSCALVLMMTAPGLAMFYSGLVRKKNVLSVMMQCIFLMGLMTTIWALYGYSLSFGGISPGANNNAYIGNLDFLFMNDVSRSWNEETKAPETPMQGSIPRLTHMLFQGMFFIITPALICGAFAERMKFTAMVLFSILWGTLIYCPLAHWVWGGGMLAFGPGLMGGALDFAGGTVVHISSGVSALITAMVLGPRLGFGREPMPPHNLTYTALGAGLLWVGWFGFNAGSQLGSDELTSSAFAATHFSAAAGALAWVCIEWFGRGKPTVLGASSGLVAGLVCITPAAGHVNPMPAIVMGLMAGVVCYFACSTLKRMFKYDDALDAFGIHGVGGTLGAVLTGVFATRACWDIAGGKPLGLIEGGSILPGQLVATLITWGFSIVGTWVILKIVDLTIGLRVSANEERQGLDVTQHGEEGYIFL